MIVANGVKPVLEELSMTSRSMVVLTAVLLNFVVAAHSQPQSESDSAIPTIPESQIESQPLSSTYEFLSTADASGEFEVRSGQMALQTSSSEAIKKLAQQMIDHHAKLQQELRDAGKADNTDIAASSPDGEQQGLLNKMKAATGSDFDRLYVESQIFAHQRLIAVFRGYQANDNNLGRLAAKTLPTLIEHYALVIETAEAFQASDAVQ